MKKVFLLVSLTLVLGLVMGCPQPTDSGEAPTPRVPLTNEQGQTLMKAVLEETVVTLTPVYEGETGGLTLKSALHAVVTNANRKEITEIRITTTDGAKIIPEDNLSYLFSDSSSNRYYEKLSTISGLEYLDTSNVTTMSSMFANCFALSSKLDLSGWEVSNVTDMSSMFMRCQFLSSLDLTGWNTSKVTATSNGGSDGSINMFFNCRVLTQSEIKTTGAQLGPENGSNVYEKINELQP